MLGASVRKGPVPTGLHLAGRVAGADPCRAGWIGSLSFLEWTRADTQAVPHISALISASACSGQNRMSISRYIVVAVRRCSCACSGLAVRR